MSVTDLAETISRDSTTMTRIIAIAGSLGYNPNGNEITSIHQAIGQIGFERIRVLAVSLLLLFYVSPEWIRRRSSRRSGTSKAGTCRGR